MHSPRKDAKGDRPLRSLQGNVDGREEGVGREIQLAPAAGNPLRGPEREGAGTAIRGLKGESCQPLSCPFDTVSYCANWLFLCPRGSRPGWAL